MKQIFAPVLWPGFKLHYFSMLASLLIDLITNFTRLMDSVGSVIQWTSTAINLTSINVMHGAISHDKNGYVMDGVEFCYYCQTL